jgi:hypothetical protein
LILVQVLQITYLINLIFFSCGNQQSRDGWVTQRLEGLQTDSAGRVDVSEKPQQQIKYITFGSEYLKQPLSRLWVQHRSIEQGNTGAVGVLEIAARVSE